MNINEIREINGVREKLLNLISGMLLNIPTYANIIMLYNGLADLRNACDDDCPISLKHGLEKLEEWLKLNDDNVKTHTKLETEHTRLFFLGKYSIGSTASYYLSSNNTNKGVAWDEVIDFYYKNKYTPQKGTLFDEDSAGVETLFLSILAGAGAKAENSNEACANINAQIEFYTNHVNNWLQIFCKALSKADNCPFYQTFAIILEGYAEADYNILKELKEEGLEI